jgi:TolA-binding protein
LPVVVAPTDAPVSPPANSGPRASTVVSARVAPVAPANEAPLASGGPSVAAFEPAPVTDGAEAPQAAQRTAMLREETALIDGAFAAMRTGAFTRAEQLLNAHQQRFPTGDLSRERARARERLREARAARAR